MTDRKPDDRPTILVLLPVFRPGFDATGPNQSTANMIRGLSDRFRFRVLADAVPGETVGEWMDYGGIERLPMVLGPLGPRGLEQVLLSTPHHAVIANGFFDRTYTMPMLALRRLGRVPRTPLILAPRGEFAKGALAISAVRKRVYRAVALATGLLKDVTYQVTDEREAEDARRFLGDGTAVAVTPNIRMLPDLPEHQPRVPGAPLRVAFLGRISPIKNLDYALDRLAEADVPVEFTLFGPADDLPYWELCQQKIAALPPSVKVVHRGSIPNDTVIPTMAQQDLLLLPTGGENYGHAIVDSLVAGTPVLISDRTRWHGLAESGCGWDIPLETPQDFVKALRETASYTPEQTLTRREAARAYIARQLDTGAAVATMGDHFAAILARGQAGPK